MKTSRLLPLSAVCFAALSLTGCGAASVAPLWSENKKDDEKVTVVISDLHLGLDHAFAENVSNVPFLVEFLKRAQATPSIDEIVIGGDFLDGWYMPFSYGPVKDYAQFYAKVAAANQNVVDAVNAIIKEGRIKVVYVPGNHDVDLSRSILSSIFPGINQARDSAGVGTYRTGIRQEVAIEHGHRYNVFCAPDSLTDEDLREGKVLFGPGYFYTRLAATSLTSGHHARSFSFPDFGLPANPSADIIDAYKLYQVWNIASATIGVDGMDFNSKVIPCGIAGYADYYAMSDLVPLYRDGKLTDTLFKGIAANWSLLQEINRVNAPMAFGPAVLEAASLPGTDAKAYSQYFDVDKSVDVVVFGHTHAPLLEKDKEGYSGKTYVNSGTWIDHNLDGDTTRNFVKIVSSATSDEVSLYTYNVDGTLSENV